MISAVVHTFNEAKNIDRCLASLDFADELVVIDMGSTDKTIEIAKMHKAKVFSHPFTGFVEPARNYGIKKAKGDWILIVDADEVIPRSLKEEIIRISKDNSQKADFYRIARKNIIFARFIKHSGWWPDYQVRFFKKGTVTWNNKIHGIPVTRGIGVELEQREEYAIVHYHYDSVGQFIDRLNRYTSIQAKEQFLMGEKVTLKEMLLRPLNEFVRRYFAQEGYKDGWHGLCLSLLQSFSEMVVVIKSWELTGFREVEVNINDFERNIKSGEKMLNYWLTVEKLKKPQALLSGIILKIRRRLYS